MEKRKADVCRKIGLVNYTFQSIWENKTILINAFEQKGFRIKRFRKPERSDVNGVLLNLIKPHKSGKVLTGSPLLTKTSLLSNF
jgi:hypothetical protein